MLKNCESITLYRNRDCFGGGRQGLPVHHRSAGEDVQREGWYSESAWSWDRENTHGGHVRLARESHLRRPATQSWNPQLNDPRSGFSIFIEY